MALGNEAGEDDSDDNRRQIQYTIHINNINEKNVKIVSHETHQTGGGDSASNW